MKWHVMSQRPCDVTLMLWFVSSGLGVEYPLYYNDHPKAVVKYEWRDIYDNHVVFQVQRVLHISMA